ncbi:MAG: hypothetical protein ACRDIB_06145, partial [Ardenticatenaceae bacterium]
DSSSYDVVHWLLTPYKCGLFLARESIAAISQELSLPLVMGERSRMLETLFRAAGQYDMLGELLKHLTRRFDDADAAYLAWASEYPAWHPYAQAWRKRLATTCTHLLSQT